MKLIYPIQNTWIDYPDNSSLALLVYLIGCNNNCKNCHNLEYQNFNSINEKIVNIDLDIFISNLLIQKEKQKTNKLVLSGGDPLFKNNLKDIKELLNNELIKDNFNICIYTGHDIDYVKENDIKNFNFIKCGKYEEQNKDKSEKTDFYIKFGSKNQKLYNNNYKLISENNVYYFREDF